MAQIGAPLTDEPVEIPERTPVPEREPDREPVPA